MKITELQKPETITKLQSSSGDWKKEAKALLISAGFKMLGSGSYGSVFKRDGDSQVLKVFGKDPGYLKWVAFCRSNPGNPYLPKFNSKPIRVKDEVFGIRMEQLEKNSDPTVAYLLGGLAQYYEELIVRRIQDGPKPAADAAPWLNHSLSFLRMAAPKLGIHLPGWETDEHLAVVLKFLHTFGDEVDLGEASNVMRRGDQIVITDPLAPS